MSYDLFLGCVLPARLPFLETSSRKVFEKLGIKLNDVDGFSCCPDPTGIELIDHKTWLALGARNLSLCNTNGGVVSFCSGCVETLKGVNYFINKDSNVKDEVNSILKKVGKKYDGKFTVKCVLNMFDKREVELEKSRISADTANPTAVLTSLSHILANLRVRIVKAPTWWEQSLGGFDILDENVIVQLFDTVMEQEAIWYKELKGEAEEEVAEGNPQQES